VLPALRKGEWNPLRTGSYLIFEESGEKWGLGFTLNLYSAVIADLDNDFKAAWLVAERGMAVARQTGEQFLIAILNDNFGYFYIRYGRYNEGQGYLEKVLEDHRQFQSLLFACQTLKWLGDASHGLNDYLKAEAYYRESLAIVLDIDCLSYGISVQQALSLLTEALEVAYQTKKPEFPRFTTFYFLDCIAAVLAV
jgi:tetratricopeptide (TPR) repeat protein